MPRTDRQSHGALTSPSAAFTDLVLEVFRLNGALVAAGNVLAEGTGLTSARWQVLGAIALAATPPTASKIARAMGLTRQAVHRLVDELEADGAVRRDLVDPDSQRTRPIVLTPRGESLYATVMRRQRPWAEGMAAGVPVAQLRATVAVLRILRQRLATPLTRR
jgi:DNA-binding MarR family transcriptional regulator